MHSILLSIKFHLVKIHCWGYNSFRELLYSGKTVMVCACVLLREEVVWEGILKAKLSILQRYGKSVSGVLWWIQWLLIHTVTSQWQGDCTETPQNNALRREKGEPEGHYWTLPRMEEKFPASSSLFQKHGHLLEQHLTFSPIETGRWEDVSLQVSAVKDPFWCLYKLLLFICSLSPRMLRKNINCGSLPIRKKLHFHS